MDSSQFVGKKVFVGTAPIEIGEGSLLWVLIDNETVNRYRCVMKHTSLPYAAALHYVVEINKPGSFIPGDETNEDGAFAMCYPMVEKTCSESWYDERPTKVFPDKFVAIETDQTLFEVYEPNMMMND